MPRIETGQAAVWYDDHRDPTVHRLPLLLVHGAGGSHLDWPAEIYRLPEANAVRIDLPGHRNSPKPGRQSVAAYAADVLAFMDALTLPRVIIAGHSMGGAVAQTMALHYPDRIAGIVLLNTGAKLSVSPQILDQVRADLPKVADLLSQWFWGDFASEQLRRLDYARQLENDPEVMYGDYLACNQFDLRDQLAHITQPTLIIGGTADKMTPFKFSVFLNEHITGSRLVAVQNTGHKTVLEQPQVVADALVEWLVEVFP